jgi:hypothetical protein
LYNKLYFDITFIWKYWKMNSKSWQDGLFHRTKWRENYQCSRLWCQIILLIIISVKKYLYVWKVLFWYKVYLEIMKDEFKILTGRTFSRNKMARKLSVFSSFEIIMKRIIWHHRYCEFESRSGRGVQHYVIKLISDLWRVSGFFQVIRFPAPPIKLTATI